MQIEGPVPIQVSHRYAASAERVYDAFLTPEKAKTFFFATPTGQMIQFDLEPKVGGTFTFVDRRPTGDAAHYGTYLELSRPNRLIFQFSVERTGKQNDIVAIEIHSDENGCEAVVNHDLDPQFAEFKDRVEKGWASMLAGLEKVL